MDSTSIRAKGGIGGWILILGCPLREKHSFFDSVQNISGPSFADCARCDYQVGRNYEIIGADGTYDGAAVYPERLECGYGKK